MSSDPTTRPHTYPHPSPAETEAERTQRFARADLARAVTAILAEPLAPEARSDLCEALLALGATATAQAIERGGLLLVSLGTLVVCQGNRHRVVCSIPAEDRPACACAACGELTDVEWDGASPAGEGSRPLRWLCGPCCRREVPW